MSEQDARPTLTRHVIPRDIWVACGSDDDGARLFLNGVRVLSAQTYEWMVDNSEEDEREHLRLVDTNM